MEVFLIKLGFTNATYLSAPCNQMPKRWHYHLKGKIAFVPRLLRWNRNVRRVEAVLQRSQRIIPLLRRC
jgi:hypothetical protein